MPLAVGPAMTANLGKLRDREVFIATLIASDRLNAGQISDAMDRLRSAGCAPTGSGWIDEGQAADLLFGLRPDLARAALENAFPQVDVAVQAMMTRHKRLLIADMDSTMITAECIDELADYAGLKPQIAAVTEAAMRGELDFVAALDARVALLKGLDARVIEQCLAERIRPTPGAAILIKTMRARGAFTLLISGGFTRFAEPVGAMIGFERVVANILGIIDGRLDGTVQRPIVDASHKAATLKAVALDHSTAIESTLAVGDGANDVLMIQSAGLGVAYHAKPIVAAAADVRVDHSDLTALLYIQGISRKDWVSD